MLNLVLAILVFPSGPSVVQSCRLKRPVLEKMHLIFTFFICVMFVLKSTVTAPLEISDDSANDSGNLTYTPQNSSASLSVSAYNCVNMKKAFAWHAQDFDGRECGSTILELHDKQVKYYKNHDFDLMTPGAGSHSPGSPLHFWAPLRWKTGQFSIESACSWILLPRDT